MTQSLKRREIYMFPSSGGGGNPYVPSFKGEVRKGMGFAEEPDRPSPVHLRPSPESEKEWVRNCLD
jgi:hypothetical protein